MRSPTLSLAVSCASYNNRFRSCDIVPMCRSSFTKVWKIYRRRNFDTAYEDFQRPRKPRIWTYFRGNAWYSKTVRSPWDQHTFGVQKKGRLWPPSFFTEINTNKSDQYWLFAAKMDGRLCRLLRSRSIGHRSKLRQKPVWVRSRPPAKGKL